VPIDWILTPILTSDIGQQTKPADEICQGTDVMLPALAAAEVATWLRRWIQRRLSPVRFARRLIIMMRRCVSSCWHRRRFSAFSHQQRRFPEGVRV